MRFLTYAAYLCKASAAPNNQRAPPSVRTLKALAQFLESGSPRRDPYITFSEDITHWRVIRVRDPAETI